MENTVTYFTPKEARKTLPLVKRIVADILKEGKDVRALASVLDGDPGEHPEVRKRITLLQTYIDELNEIGCYYKDWNFDIGLVDFPSVIEGEEVLLCWRSDEEEIIYYHREEDGFAGRKPIPPEYLD